MPKKKSNIHKKTASQQATKQNSFRELIKFYMIDCKSPMGKLVDIFIILLNLIICFIFVLETYPIAESTRALLWKIEIITVIFFIVEYLARLYGARDRFKHVKDIYSIIDLLAILPTLSLIFIPATLNIGFVRIIRVFRVFRIFRFLRFTADPNFFFGRVTLMLFNILRLAITILLIFFVSSGLFYHVESQINPEINTFGDAFYFTVVTLTTVGFGDIIPLSEAGRWITVLMIISAIILIPWHAGQIVKQWRSVGKKEATCPTCGLTQHDEDASHCKACGTVIFQKYGGT
ncbi:ion transporter [Candidatus Woesearchaeota archaeon]|nr:ion transporter [Candidatus Woesearchaeota archaeon]